MLNMRYQRFISRIAVALLLFASLAPTVSRALASAEAAAVMQASDTTSQEDGAAMALSDETCERSGNADHSSPAHFATLAHCPFCFFHAGDVVLPSVSLTLFLAEFNDRHRPEVYSPPVVYNHIQSAHLLRAPPQA